MRGKFRFLLIASWFFALGWTGAWAAPIDESELSATYLQTASTDSFVKELESRSVPLEEWLSSLSQSEFNFLCLGESHTSAFRQLLAEQVFSVLRVDQLMLEATQQQVQSLQDQLTKSPAPESVGLLGAPIGPLLSVVKSSSPSHALYGVDVTEEQKNYSNLNPQKGLARDGWITRNILEVYQPGGRAVALYGASHCAKNNVDGGWMRPFYSMLGEAVATSEKLLSVKVIVAAERASYPLSAEQTLLLYLKDSKVGSKSFVLPNLSAISKRSYNSKVTFLSLFESYDALVVLRP